MCYASVPSARISRAVRRMYAKDATRSPAHESARDRTTGHPDRHGGTPHPPSHAHAESPWHEHDDRESVDPPHGTRKFSRLGRVAWVDRRANAAPARRVYRGLF